MGLLRAIVQKSSTFLLNSSVCLMRCHVPNLVLPIATRRGFVEDQSGMLNRDQVVVAADDQRWAFDYIEGFCGDVGLKIIAGKPFSRFSLWRLPAFYLFVRHIVFPFPSIRMGPRLLNRALNLRRLRPV